MMDSGFHSRKLNSVYSLPRMKRRYEVWFLRCGLPDGSGAWWFRYLLMNPGRHAVDNMSARRQFQVWATWFPRNENPQSFIVEFPFEHLEWSARGEAPFYLRIAGNGFEENHCWGNLAADGHAISWDLRLRSNFSSVLSDKGWIGFSRSSHSDAEFSGEITFDGKKIAGTPLGFGVQGHNCGYRHRTYWRWAHAHFTRPGGGASTIEALVYDLPLGLMFRNVVLWHEGKKTVLRRVKEQEVVREEERLKWVLSGIAPDGSRAELSVEGLAPGIHRLPYRKTDGSGTFPVANASLARATLRLGSGEVLENDCGAVLEMGGES
jgi:hypothetical protein